MIVDLLLRHPDHDNQMRARRVLAKGHPGVAASDAEDDLLYQIRAHVWKYPLGFHNTRILTFPCEELFEKSFRVVDLAVVREQLNDLADCIHRFSRAQP